LIFLLNRKAVIRAAPCPQEDPAFHARPVIAEIGALLLVRRENGTLKVLPTGSSDRAKQAAICDLLADFDVGAIAELEHAVTKLVAAVTDARGHVDERLVRLEFKMRASRRAGSRFEQRGDDRGL
jgi:hypothetical protein